MLHATVDIETLSTAVDTVVLSIGAVLFTESTIIGEGFHVVLNRAEQMPLRAVSDSTLTWWMDQSQAARDAIWKAPQTKVPLALGMLDKAIYGAERVWCRGLNFDVPILDHLYIQNGMRTPWPYNSVRDSRTLLEQVDPESLPKMHGVAHNALDDARHEAVCVSIGLRRLQHQREAAQRLERASLAMTNNDACAAAKPQSDQPPLFKAFEINRSGASIR